MVPAFVKGTKLKWRRFSPGYSPRNLEVPTLLEDTEYISDQNTRKRVERYL